MFLKPVPLFSRTPPAIFPPIMGAFGLGIAWRRAGEVFGLPSAIGDLLLGAVTLLFVFAAVAYLAKVVRRPGVVPEDLRILPGRAGLSAGSLSVALLAAALVPVAPEAARIALMVAGGLHLTLAALVVYVLLSGPKEQRGVTPIWHLSFVGFILLPLSAAPLGYTALSTGILYGTALMALGIYAVSLGQMIRRDPPSPLRPLLAIHLAPASLIGTVSALLGYQALALSAAAIAVLIAAALIVKARYLTESGFSPLYGAFTFPSAAFAGMLMLLSILGWGPANGAAAGALGAFVLVLASAIVPVILVKVLQLWARGQLAVKTNAAAA